MKTMWTITALLGFISVSVFGLVLMPYDGSHHDTSCLASIINNLESPCPEDDPLGFANFHGNAVSKISNLVLVDSVSVIYLAMLAMFIFGLFFIRQLRAISSFSIISISEAISISHPLRDEQRNWFSLHENSPSSA